MIIRLPTFWTILLDCIAWALIQTGVAYLAIRLPRRWLNPRSWLLRTRPWERGGDLYERLFRVRRWKTLLPSGGGLFRGGFSMRSLQGRDAARLHTWVLESCRAEICHWVAIAPSLLFFIWNPPGVGWVMIAYAVLVNAPCIIAQRYNRPRFQKIVEHRGVRPPPRPPTATALPPSPTPPPPAPAEAPAALTAYVEAFNRADAGAVLADDGLMYVDPGMVWLDTGYIETEDRAAVRNHLEWLFGKGTTMEIVECTGEGEKRRCAAATRDDCLGVIPGLEEWPYDLTVQVSGNKIQVMLFATRSLSTPQGQVEAVVVNEEGQKLAQWVQANRPGDMDKVMSKDYSRTVGELTSEVCKAYIAARQ